MSLNVLDVRMMDRYWSETMPLRAVPVTTVEPTRPVRVRVSGSRTRARSAPEA